jgi:hypothetical protein
MQAAAQTVDKLQKGCRFRFENALHHQLAGGIQNCRGNRYLMNIQANILGVIHDGLLSVGMMRTIKTYSKVRPFIMRSSGLRRLVRSVRLIGELATDAHPVEFLQKLYFQA